MGKTGQDADASAETMGNKPKDTKNEISDLQGVGGTDGNSYLERDCSLPKEKKGRKRSEKKKTAKLRSNEDGVEDEDRLHKGNLVNACDVRKKDKKKRKRDSSEKTQTEENDNNRIDGAELSMEDSESEKIDNKKKKLDAQNSDNVMNEIMIEESTLGTQNNTEDSKVTKEKKKTTKSVENNNGKAKAKGKGKSKKVSFAGHAEVFPSSDREPENQSTKGDGLIRGKRFTPDSGRR